MRPRIKPGYVRTKTGFVLVLRPAHNRWGWELADEDLTWPGGIGAADSWEYIDESEVDPADRMRLGWLLLDSEGES